MAVNTGPWAKIVAERGDSSYLSSIIVDTQAEER